MKSVSPLRLVSPTAASATSPAALDDEFGVAPPLAARQPEPERPETAGAQTLRRGLAVLRLLTRVGPGGLRMGEIGHRLGLNKTTAIRDRKSVV